jgi:hypothetical protein
MATTLEQLAEQAMKLPSESRARLADLLVEQQWITEPKRRRDEVRDGRVETIRAKKVSAKCVTPFGDEI